MLLHLDGSLHRWFEHEQDEYQCLLVLMDDATSECLAARFVRREGTREVLGVIREVVEKRGTFIALYTDRAGHFVYTPKAGGPPDRSKKTQVERVLDELGIELIAAGSPQARGRGERNFGTYQGRLVPELRRAGAVTYAQANRYLQEVFVPKFNRKFTVPASEKGTAFIPVVGADLDRIFSLRYERKVQGDNTVRFENRVLQLPKMPGCTTFAGRKAEIRVELDGKLKISCGKRLIVSLEPEDATQSEDEFHLAAAATS
jgi:hypothetical protein